MEATTLSSAATIVSSSSSSLSIFSPKKRTYSSSPRIVRLSKKDDKDYDPKFETDSLSLVPLFQNQTLSNVKSRSLSEDEAMGLVLSAASVRGWTTGSGMEGPSLPAKADAETISTFPWSLFMKSPRRRMRCCGCNVFHKLVDNLNLFHEVKYYVSSSSSYQDAKWDVGGFNLFQMDDDTDDD
ncbi:hypothetical protein BRARA_B02675 [Brassica rapa]|uniref:Uncharacterized protein n=1 Tax=Brassica campestris TaxID=3711 RepID=A0A398ACU1_BRACM|nr:hypothetical protein BRARA_B02675 [Brassica rapa]